LSFFFASKKVFLIIALICSGARVAGAQVSVTTGVDEGRDAIIVSTSTAKWYMDIKGGGFSSLVDTDGNDWISWSESSTYNGIPNLRFPANVFHPGQDKCTTWVETQSSEAVTLISRTLDNKWQCAWKITDSHATCTVDKVGNSYWFLYEGTPGGVSEKDTDFWIRSDGSTNTLSNGFGGDMAGPEWVVFGDSNLGRVLFFFHHEDDNLVDKYYLQGTMTVFGFGRDGGSKLLEETPQNFSIGFIDASDYETIKTSIEALGLTGDVTEAKQHSMVQNFHYNPRRVHSGNLFTINGRKTPVVQSGSKTHYLLHKEKGVGFQMLVAPKNKNAERFVK